MYLTLEQRVRDAFAAHIRNAYSLDIPIVVEQPRDAQFGELALPAAFALAKQLRQPPRKIASELASAIAPIPGIAELEVAGNGYINVRFDRAAYAAALLQGEPAPPPAPGKIIVEHTNINPNKAAHIGHLRNAVLGDAFVRMLRARGHQVEVQNYIDNTGVQVADVVAGFHFLENKTPEDVSALIADPAVRFDYYCWDLYARISRHYETDPAALHWRAETLHSIEEGRAPLVEIGHLVADAIVELHLNTMLRLGVQYDVLPRESEILHLQFWATAFELLKQRGVIHLESEGKNAGCWVMPAEAFRESGEDTEDSKVIVRSNGTVTYVGKDIAYQLWKFGLLGRDFRYRRLRTYPDGHELWVSTDEPQPGLAPSFGGGSRVYNVIDVRQSYLQRVVQAGLRALGCEREAENSIHFAYEMVALSPRCCAELGIELSEEDRRRPYIEVSGRKGLGVKADDFIDALLDKALEEVRSRHPNDSPEYQRSIAGCIAIGALRYFLLKFTRASVIAFDFQEALAFEGETGPYAQYAAVRARNIFNKLRERGETLPDFAAALSEPAFARQLASEDFWQVLLGASQADSVIEKALAAGEPAHLARYAFQLAQSFNNFYHQHHILSESDREKRTFLLWMTQFFASQLARVLAILGIDTPEVM
ncbi:MAG: arginine--tRNA ligase [Acidobacteria bacterium]|nr:arginine--tRNA ligase [Acidobacteriota bacterium]